MASITKAAAKAAGTIKGAAKAIAGYPAIFNHLAQEHAEVSLLMKRVAASEDDSEVRDELFPEIYANLSAHAEGEEKTFYPPLRRFAEVRSLVEECLQEHMQIKSLLEQLHSSPRHTASWLSTFERLMHAVEQHVEREENELFPRSSELLGSEQAEEIEARYEKVEEQVKANANV